MISKVTVKQLCQVSIIAAIYVSLTMVNPLSWGPFQFRISNVLCAYPFFRRQSAIGILIGIAIANFFSPLGLLDVLFGVAAEGIAYLLLCWGPLKNVGIALKNIVLSILVAGIVGIELTLVYGVDYILNFVSLFVTTLVVAMAGTMLFKRLRVLW